MIFVHPHNPVVSLVCLAAGILLAYGLAGVVLLLPMTREQRTAPSAAAAPAAAETEAA